MLSASYRDVDDVPALQEPMQALQAYLDSYRDALLAAWQVPPARRAPLRAVMTLLTRFASWQTLADEGLPDDDIVTLALACAAVVAEAPAPRRPTRRRG